MTFQISVDEEDKEIFQNAVAEQSTANNPKNSTLLDIGKLSKGL